MNMYVIMGMLLIQYIVMIGMEVQTQEISSQITPKRTKKREVLQKIVVLKRTRSKPIPIVGSGSFLIENDQCKVPADIFKSSNSEQSFSPTVRDIFELQ